MGWSLRGHSEPHFPICKVEARCGSPRTFRGWCGCPSSCPCSFPFQRVVLLHQVGWRASGQAELLSRGHADGEKRRLSKLRGKQEGMPRRESSGKGPRGRQKAELGLQWEGAGEGGTSRGGGASGLRADGGRFALLSRTLHESVRDRSLDYGLHGQRAAGHSCNLISYHTSSIAHATLATQPFCCFSIMGPWVEGSSLTTLAPTASSYPSLNSQGQAWLIAC